MTQGSKRLKDDDEGWKWLQGAAIGLNFFLLPYFIIETLICSSYKIGLLQ